MHKISTSLGLSSYLFLFSLFQQELECAVERYATQLQELRSQLSSKPAQPMASQNTDCALGEKVDNFLQDLECVIRDIIDTVKENDAMVASLAKER